MPVQDAPDILFHPPLLSVMVPALAVALEWIVPLSALPPAGTWATMVPGFVFCAAAGWLAVSGERAFRAAGTNVDPRQPALKLVQDGPFRFTRNPMYLGMIILQAGLGFVFSLDWMLLLAPVLWALLHFGVVLREEDYLTDKFGDPYAAYVAQSKRWL